MLSFKSLERAFPGKGQEIRDLLTKKTKTSDYKTVNQWIEKCLFPPCYVERLEKALNEILEGYGSEAIFSSDNQTVPCFTYVNLGDTYTTTLIRDYDKETWIISSWGDYLEYKEKKGFQFN
jgi:hypothetical protein